RGMLPLTPSPSPARGEGRGTEKRQTSPLRIPSGPLSPCGRGARGEGASARGPAIDISRVAHRFVIVIAHVALLCFGTDAARADELPDPLPGTTRLQLDQPLDVVMVDGISRFAERALAQSIANRAEHWHRDVSSPAAYAKSVAPNRERLQTILGAVDTRTVG